MNIITAEKEHLDGMVALERECFSRPWSEQSFTSEMESADARVAVAVEGEELLGFAILHRMGYEAELFNIAVWPEKRGRGIGKALLDDVMNNARENDVESVFLEVRATNEPAKKMYEAAGFKVCGVRKNYYDDPVEDAILMEAEIC